MARRRGSVSPRYLAAETLAVIAPREVKSISELQGKTVSFGDLDSATSTSGRMLFSRLGVTANQTNEPLPEDLLKRFLAARKFNQGFATVEFVSSALLDLEFHSQPAASVTDVRAFEREGVGLMVFAAPQQDGRSVVSIVAMPARAARPQTPVGRLTGGE